MPGDVHDLAYYQKCMVGGILSCGITHTLICPLDIIKCRKQVSFTTCFRSMIFITYLFHRQTPSFIRASEMDSRLFTELKVSQASKS
jgi:hypothetical protein